MTPTENTPANGKAATAVAKRFSIAGLEKMLPSPEEVAVQAQELRAASVAAIDVAGVNEMMAAVMENARKGDVKSVRLILDHLDRHKPEPKRPAPPVQVTPHATSTFTEPPKAVAIPGPSAEAHRRMVAYVLLAHQPMSVHGLGVQCGLDGDALEAVLNHEWFARQNGQVRLTPAGRNAIG